MLFPHFYISTDDNVQLYFLLLSPSSSTLSTHDNVQLPITFGFKLMNHAPFHISTFPQTITFNIGATTTRARSISTDDNVQPTQSEYTYYLAFENKSCISSFKKLTRLSETFVAIKNKGMSGPSRSIRCIIRVSTGLHYSPVFHFKMAIVTFLLFSPAAKILKVSITISINDEDPH